MNRHRGAAGLSAAVNHIDSAQTQPPHLSKGKKNSPSSPVAQKTKTGTTSKQLVRSVISHSFTWDQTTTVRSHKPSIMNILKALSHAKFQQNVMKKGQLFTVNSVAMYKAQLRQKSSSFLLVNMASSHNQLKLMQNLCVEFFGLHVEFLNKKIMWK